MTHRWTLSFYVLFCPFLDWYEPQGNGVLVWMHYLHSGLAITHLWRPLGVSVVLTWHQRGLDNEWYLSNAVLSVRYLCYLCPCLSSFLVISLSDSRCPCLRYDYIFHFIIAVFFLSFCSYDSSDMLFHCWWLVACIIRYAIYSVVFTISTASL